MSERPNKLKEQLARVREKREGTAASAETALESPTFIADDASVDPVPTKRRSRPRTAGRRRPSAGEAWDERVKRATFYVDRDLHDQLDECCDRHDLNKSEFVREAITRHLQTFR